MTDITTLLPNKEQFDIMNKYLAMIAHNTETMAIETFEDIQKVFRKGLGKTIF